MAVAGPPRISYEVVNVLKETSDRFASQIDNCLFEINHITGKDKELIIKDTGYRSVLRGYLDPFLYAGEGEFTDDPLDTFGGAGVVRIAKLQELAGGFGTIGSGGPELNLETVNGSIELRRGT